MSYKNKEELNKYADKGYFFTVLEILNNSLYNENFNSFNEKLNEMVETGEYNYSKYLEEINSVKKIASNSILILNNQRYAQYEDYKSFISLKFKLRILLNR